MIRPWDMQLGNTPLGALLAIAAGVMFSLYGVLGTRTIHQAGPFAQTSFSFLFGSLVLLLVLIVMGRPIIAGVSENLPIVIYTGIVVCGIGYLTYFYAVKFSNATTASIIFLLKPVIAPIIAVIVLHEQITWNMFVGIALILVATIVRTFTPATLRKKDSPA
jgi:drug/metabolite transporter (DMT)-like permease